MVRASPDFKIWKLSGDYTTAASTLPARRFGTAAIDRQFRSYAFLFEQLLSHCGFRDGGRPIGLGGQPHADGFGVRRKRRGQQGGRDQRRHSVAAREPHCYVSSVFVDSFS